MHFVVIVKNNDFIVPERHSRPIFWSCGDAAASLCHAVAGSASRSQLAGCGVKWLFGCWYKQAAICIVDLLAGGTTVGEVPLTSEP